MNYKKKITRKLLPIISLIFVCSSCANKKVNINSTVDFSTELNQENIPSISTNHFDNSTYGPSPQNLEINSDKLQIEPSWALVVLPARSRVFELIKVLKLFETYKLRPNVVVAYEYAALLMYPFSQKMRIGELEWLIYQSFNKNDETIEDWASHFKNELKTKFALFNLDKSYPLLALPMWQVSGASEVLIDSGTVENWLKLTTLEMKSYAGHIAGWLRTFNVERIRQHYGVDKIVVIDLFGDKILFNQSDDYLHGVYGTYLSVKKNKIVTDKNIIILNLSIAGVDQDQMPVAAEILKTPSEFYNEQIGKLKSQLSEGIEN